MGRLSALATGGDEKRFQGDEGAGTEVGEEAGFDAGEVGAEVREGKMSGEAQSAANLIDR